MRTHARTHLDGCGRIESEIEALDVAEEHAVVLNFHVVGEHVPAHDALHVHFLENEKKQNKNKNKTKKRQTKTDGARGTSETKRRYCCSEYRVYRVYRACVLTLGMRLYGITAVYMAITKTIPWFLLLIPMFGGYLSLKEKKLSTDAAQHS